MNLLLLGTIVIIHVVSTEANNFLDVKLAVELKHVPSACRHKPKPCKLSYAISLLKAHGTYELHALMLQDGFLIADKHKRYLHENTVITIPANAMKDQGKNLFLGIKIFGLPGDVQDYFVLDASRALKNKSEKSKTTSEHSKIVFTSIITKGTTYVERTTNGCYCAHKECTCCEHLDVPIIHLNHTGCLSVAYIPKDYALNIVFSLDGDVVYNDTISARNPPPICLHLPFLKEYAALCIRFTQIKLSSSNVHMCITTLAELYHVPVMEHSFGCVDIPVITN